ncbi:MAG TPA: cation transporter [Vicinamibacterales bacterium]|nr:cation transporter [Vicinamibacterales bacterium]
MVQSQYSTPEERQRLLARGRRLEYFTLAWNGAEGLVGIVAGLAAGSISLVGFGVDSFIEVASGGTLLWRMSVDGDACHRERRDVVALRIVGLCFLGLSGYVAYAAIHDLWTGAAPEHSAAGIVLACAALVVMPLLSRAKRRVGAALRSSAMQADARQADFCAYLSAILLAGLLLNLVWGWWWADPIAALIMAPIIANEGIAGLRSRACCDEPGYL